MNKRKVILRADGSNKTGLGHVFRLLSFAQLLGGDFDRVFVTNITDVFVLEEIKKVCGVCIQLQSPVEGRTSQEIAKLEEIPFDLDTYVSGTEIVVLDGYLFGSNYQQAVKEAGCFLICIDDLATHHFFADAVINHAPGIDPSIYNTERYTQLLTGLNYAILRPPFFKAIPSMRTNRTAFVSLGGTDYYGYTAELAKLLVADQSFSSINILMSSSFKPSLLSKLGQLQESYSNIQLHSNLTGGELCDLLDTCSHSFVAASSVLIESYARGVKCFTGHYANNQLLLHKGFIQKGMAASLGNFNDLDMEKFQKVLRTEDDISVLSEALTRSNLQKFLFSVR